ncbi:hypothetical protein FGO68_gene6018 [Halteria grandinella]|uniref:Uncharacterized protein n=1 Tax=Halteria grandinella TaxID=5974 RepID=A0A8J8NT94_HALGN|nr:hypothetical protein FGO68_gene6018 [Halteria grandinella]
MTREEVGKIRLPMKNGGNQNVEKRPVGILRLKPIRSGKYGENFEEGSKESQMSQQMNEESSMKTDESMRNEANREQREALKGTTSSPNLISYMSQLNPRTKDSSLIPMVDSFYDKNKVLKQKFAEISLKTKEATSGQEALIQSDVKLNLRYHK